MNSNAVHDTEYNSIFRWHVRTSEITDVITLTSNTLVTNIANYHFAY